MTVYFFDSSALTKRYMLETGTNWVRQVVLPSAGNTILIARITPVEVTSAIARHKRDQNVSGRTARAMRLFLDRHAAREYQIVQITDAILQRAQDLLDTHPLRAFDAIQLASAVEVNQRIIAGNQLSLIFVSSDVRLLTAAAAESLSIHQPV